ncbi:MAG: hypothetical protein NC416_09635 [Eubacterium sp.]|nr:hypothetical protein [Eubacterium sp.]
MEAGIFIGRITDCLTGIGIWRCFTYGDTATNLRGKRVCRLMWNFRDSMVYCI